MKRVFLDDKGVILAFRFVIFLLLGSFLLYSPTVEKSLSLLPFSLIGVYFLSNVLLVLVPAETLSRPLARSILFLCDILAISLVIYTSGEFSSDLYLIYFLVIFISGTQMRARDSFITGSVAALLYVFLWLRQEPADSFWTTHVLLRLPFFYLMSFFAAYFAEQTQNARRLMEVEIQKQAEIVQRRTALGRLAAKVALELNDPLSVILGFSQSLLKRVSSSHDLALPAQSIEREARRCKTVLENLKLLTDDPPSALDVVDVNTALDAALSALKTKMAHISAIDIRRGLMDNIPLIRGDQRQIDVALQQLLKNAVEAVSEGGALKLDTRTEESENGIMVCVDISDTGKGISQGVRDKIFEPFFTTKSEEPGAGLGLTLATAIAQRHGGSILLAPGRDAGTRFTILLPAMRNHGKNN